MLPLLAQARETHTLETDRRNQGLELVSASLHVRDFPDPVRHINHYKFLPRLPDDNGILFQFDVILRNADWKRMSHYQGEHAFIQDDALDMALKLLAHDLSMPANDIANSTSFESQICTKQVCTKTTTDKLADRSTKEELRDRLGHAAWIFMPINDGTSDGSAFFELFENPASCKREDGEVKL